MVANRPTGILLAKWQCSALEQNETAIFLLSIRLKWSIAIWLNVF